MASALLAACARARDASGGGRGGEGKAASNARGPRIAVSSKIGEQKEAVS
jgi:hypothetical protein